MTAHLSGSGRHDGLRHLAFTLGATLAALALTACSTNLHPGNAAIVNGTAISQSQVDTVTSSVCSYITALAKTSPAQSAAPPQQYGIADLKASLTSSLVQFAITQDVADHTHLTVRTAQIDALASQYTLPDGLSTAEKATMQTYFDEASRAQILQSLIGANLKDRSVTTSDSLTSSQIADPNKKFMDTYYKAADVSLNPSYGTWNGTRIDAGTGSLSDPVYTPSPTATTSGAVPATGAATLPDAQKCG